MTTLKTVLEKHKKDFSTILPTEIQHGKAYIMNLSTATSDFSTIDFCDVEALVNHTTMILQKHNAAIGIGRYAEERFIYQNRELYCDHGQYTRTLHLGIDLSAPAGTPIFAPLDARVHSFQNNADLGDYGPTIILEHELEGITFFTLYGHLSLASLQNIQEKQVIKKGESFATIGTPEINGGWPPHLHFQIIDDMENNYGNFYGVVEPEKKEEYLSKCPDPELILNIKVMV